MEKRLKKFIENHIQGNDLVFLGFIVSDALVSPKLKDHISTLASSLANRDAKLVLMDDLYLAQANDNACEDGLLPYKLGIQEKASNTVCQINKRHSRNYQSLLRYDQFIASIIEMNSNVHHFSIRNQLCPVEECPRKLDDGTPIYQDESHLFPGAAQNLALS